MSKHHDFVLLAECSNMVELHSLRATLEARGIPFQIQGEHTHSFLGPIQGAMVRSRVLVPLQALPIARNLTENILGPFAEEQPEFADVDESPFRKSAEQEADEIEPEVMVRPKSYAVLLIIGMLVVAPLFGLAHIYVHRNTRAGILALISILSIALLIRGVLWATLLLVVVWVVDLTGGAFGISAYNRAISRSHTPA